MYVLEVGTEEKEGDDVDRVTRGQIVFCILYSSSVHVEWFNRGIPLPYVSCGGRERRTYILGH